MARLAEILTQPSVRPQVVQACAELIDAEVAAKSGLSGLAVKAGYKLVKAIKPGMVGEVCDRLLPEFAEAMQPFYAEASLGRSGKAAADAFAAQLSRDPAKVAAALLTVTDRRAEKASGPLKKTYARLRDTAEAHVQQAVPGLAQKLAPFVG
jgi:hypothetical protein